MSNANKTERLVRKCACKGCRPKYPVGCSMGCPAYFYKVFARAARKFVKAENIQKAHEAHMKFVRWCRKHPFADKG